MRVAISGGIGEGKSTVLGMLQDLGQSVVSADSVAREVFQEPATRLALARIADLHEAFSAAELRQAIAASDEVRRAVNRLMHPLVLQRLESREETFIEVPLLIEACLQSRFDRVWVVTCGPEEQRRRLLERYGDPTQVEGMLASQLPTRAKIPFADLVIRTNASLEHVRRLLYEALGQLGIG